MCRIVGFWDFNYKGEYKVQEIIESMRDALVHGGPDDAGVYIDPSCCIALGHRRLSILDLSPSGRQPMEFDDLVITYNGEIYNFRDIRKELEAYGYKFSSNTDTEVVVKSFHRWGVSALCKFRGMFAFAIWDKKRERLILCRDRVGVKPIYYYYRDGLFMFASELKAFHEHPKFKRELEDKALALFLKYGYIPTPLSIFKNTHKLEPGHFLILENNGTIKKEPYWRVEDFFLKGYKEREQWLKRSEEDLTQELEDLLTESFKLRLISDVPVGMFLSGGIDSSTVCAILSKETTKLKTFTIGFHEVYYNEAPFAKRIAEYLGTDHTELYCTPREAFEIIPKLPEIYDEPFGDPSSIPTYLVSRLASSKVKVSLSADGGDEQFCGYTRYLVVNRINESIFAKPPFRQALLGILDLLSPELAFKIYNVFKPFLPKYKNFKDKYRKFKYFLKADNLVERYDIAISYFLEEDLRCLGIGHHKLNIKYTNSTDSCSYLMLRDMQTYLPDDILVKVDRATMSVGLEGREPLLDHKLVEWTSTLPYEFKYRNGKTKYLLRKVLYKYIPPELIDRPKKGFEVPIYEWFKSDLKELYMEYLSDKKIKEGGIFNPLKVKKLLQDFLMDRGVNHYKLWLLFIFEQWRTRWL